MNKTGFGFLRLPRLNPDDESSINIDLVCSMADRFIALGGNYFDTAYTYQNGRSELALREAVVNRYPRESIRVASKLPTWLLKEPGDCRKFFDEQLQRSGLDYFDVYLMHGIDAENYETCIACGGFDFLRSLKKSGEVRSIGFSFHDSPQLLERILSENPDVEYVLLQINYLDWESETIQSRKCYETARKHNKKILIMEPLKGGNLAKLPDEAAEVLRQVNPDATPANWAMRFVQGLEGVEIVLSGMNALSQMEENMRDMEPLSPAEAQALAQAAQIIRSQTAVACTGCSYCTAGCPQGVPIPQLFSIYNEYARCTKEKWKMEYIYADLAKRFAPASACIGCRACESACPQKLEITANLAAVVEVFEDGKKSPIK